MDDSRPHADLGARRQDATAASGTADESGIPSTPSTTTQGVDDANGQPTATSPAHKDVEDGQTNAGEDPPPSMAHGFDHVTCEVDQSRSDPTTLRGSSSGDYDVEVDWSVTNGQIEDLMGLDKTPLNAAGYKPGLAMPPRYAMSILYRKAGSTIARSQNTGMAVANLFHGPDWTEGQDHTPDQYHTRGWTSGVVLLDRNTGEQIRFENPNTDAGYPLHFDRQGDWGDLAEDIDETTLRNMGYIDSNTGDVMEPEAGECWLYWALYGSERMLNRESNFELDSNGVLEAYEALRGDGFDLYFEANEDGNECPSYYDEPGESADGLTDGKRLYALVAARALDLLCRSSGGFAPTFCELFSEPEAGGHYTGPYAGPIEDMPTMSYFASGLQWSRDFAALYTEMFDALNDVIDDWIADGLITEEQRPQLGGLGCLSASAMELNGLVDMVVQGFGLLDMLDGNRLSRGSSMIFALLMELVRDTERDLLDFVAVHWYGDNSIQDALAPGRDEPYLTPDITTPAVMLRQLASICRGVRRTFELFGRDCPPIHISEWNYSLAKDAGVASFGNFSGAHVSAALTWMQHRWFGIERALAFAGFEPTVGLFTRGQDVKELFDDLSSALGVEFPFAIRRGAMAMSLHAGLAGWFRLRPEVPGTDVYEVPDDDIDMEDDLRYIVDPDLYRELLTEDQLLYRTATGDLQIAVLAARRTIAPGAMCLVVTNLENKVKNVTIRMDSLDDGTSYDVVQTTLHEFPNNGLYEGSTELPVYNPFTGQMIDHDVDENLQKLAYALPVPVASGTGAPNDPYVPSQAWVDFWFALFMPQTEWEDPLTPSGGRVDCVIEQIPAYGVVRLDITPQGVPVNTMAGLSITFGEPTSEHETWPHVIDDIHLEPDHQANDWAFMSGFQADFRAIADLFDLSGIETPLELFDALDIHDPRQLVVMLDQGPMPGLVGAMMNNVLR